MTAYYVQYLVALLIFGTNGVFSAFIDLEPCEIVFMRLLLGSICLLAFFFLKGNRLTCFRYPKDLLFLVLSGVSLGANYIFLYEAYARLGVGTASLLNYCGPVIVMALAPILFKERLTIAKLIGFAGVLLGVFLINSNQMVQGGDIMGIICGLLGAVTYAMLVITNKQSKNIAGMENSILQLVISFLTVAVVVGLRTGYAFEVQRVDWIWIVILGLLNTGFACTMYFGAINRLPVQSVAVLGYLEPLGSVVFSALFLHESLGIARISGAVLIIGGAIYCQLCKPKAGKTKICSKDIPGNE